MTRKKYVSLKTVIRDTAADLSKARRELRLAERAQQRAEQSFARGKLTVDALTAAVRRHAVAEVRVTDLASVLQSMQSIADDKRGVR